MERVKYNTGAGTGYGYGYGKGTGYGYGTGNGTGYGIGTGTDYGYGSGYGTGTGYGIGTDYGCGSGYGKGKGKGIKSLNGMKVKLIDDIPTILLKKRGNISKGYILERDMTLEKCFVVEQDGVFAHGRTLREAQKALGEKIFEEMSDDERIELFLEKFNHTDKYPAKVFFEWHGKLTGSCMMGREVFVKDKEIDLDNDMLTLNEFIELTEKSYGSEIIRRLKK